MGASFDAESAVMKNSPIAVSPMFSASPRHSSMLAAATGKKWVRFTLWDSAGNGAFTPPVQIP
jgi:hypothetical protein